MLTVSDRFIQQPVPQVLTPIFEEQFHNHSYGFRPNRCAQQAVLKALEMMNGGHSWIHEFVLHNGYITTAQATELLGVKQRRARGILGKMVDNHWLRKEGASRSTVYVINTARR